MVECFGVSLAECAVNEAGSLEECTGLAIDPIFPGIGVAFASLGFLQLRWAAKPLRNVGVIDEGATALRVLLPSVGTVEQCLAEHRLVAQVGGVIEGLDKLDSVGMDGATPCGAAGGDCREGRGEGGFSRHGMRS